MDKIKLTKINCIGQWNYYKLSNGADIIFQEIEKEIPEGYEIKVENQGAYKFDTENGLLQEGQGSEINDNFILIYLNGRPGTFDKELFDQYYIWQ